MLRFVQKSQHILRCAMQRSAIVLLQEITHERAQGDGTVRRLPVQPLVSCPPTVLIAVCVIKLYSSCIIL